VGGVSDADFVIKTEEVVVLGAAVAVRDRSHRIFWTKLSLA
jgi:hypothetical protein